MQQRLGRWNVNEPIERFDWEMEGKGGLTQEDIDDALLEEAVALPPSGKSFIVVPVTDEMTVAKLRELQKIHAQPCIADCLKISGEFPDFEITSSEMVLCFSEKRGWVHRNTIFKGGKLHHTNLGSWSSRDTHFVIEV